MSVELKPFFKYPGGKESELYVIKRNLPLDYERYYEPFVGGGAVFFTLNNKQSLINDKSEELINLYNLVKSQDIVFFNQLKAINQFWIFLGELTMKHENHLFELINQFRLKSELRSYFVKNLINIYEKNIIREKICDLVYFNLDEYLEYLSKSILKKIDRTIKIESTKKILSNEDYVKTIESAVKSSFYIYLRHIYNKLSILSESKADLMSIYLFIREFCYSSMFRYNSNGEFNVPYGGISYNRKSLTSKIKYMQDQKLINLLNATTIVNEDFYDFMSKYPPKMNDFIFVDPPYDTDFSTYSKNIFDKNDQIRLSKYLLENCEAKFMMIIKDSELISSLYQNNTTTKLGKKITIERFEKNYSVSFKNRNKRDVIHLIIKNY